VTNERNRELLQEYMKYQVGIGDLALGNIRNQLCYIKKFLVYFNTLESICEITEEQIAEYFKLLQEEEIKAIIQESTAEGEIQEVEQDIVERVFNLGDRDLGSIMTHRSDLIWLNIQDSNETLRETVNAHLHTIYPVADTKLDNIVGIVFLKDLFGRMDAPDFDLKAIVRPPQYFPQNQSVYNAMEHLKQGHTKYGLVTDEFGSIEGIVTLQDILKALIGDLPELGEEPDIVQREDGTYLVDGQCPFYDFLAHFDMECLYTNHYYNTLSGLILKILEHIPQTGEKLTWYNFEFEIVDMDAARIDKVLVKINKETD